MGGQTHKRQQQIGGEWLVPTSIVHGTKSWAKIVGREIGAGTRKK